MGMDMYICLLDWATYRDKILPAEKLLEQNGDEKPLIELLSQIVAMPESDDPMAEGLWSRDVYQENMDVLTGRIPRSFGVFREAHFLSTKEERLQYARSNVVPNIVNALGVARHRSHVNPEQNVGRDRINPYLCERSPWIDELFTFGRTVRGEHLEFPIGESTELFTADDLKDFQAALNKVPRPEDPELRQQYDNLATLVNIALTDSSTALGISVM